MIDAKLGMSGMPVTCRAVFIFGPDKKMKLQILYPASTGRNFAEVRAAPAFAGCMLRSLFQSLTQQQILRVVDSLQLTANYSVATPANWTQGQPCMVVPSLSDEAAAEKFPKGFDKAALPSGKGYIRLTPQPNL
jgi:1-Cys peroxiredoxin 6